MRILLWHVHAAWATAFVAGPHDYVVPVTADRGPDGRGRPRTYDWPLGVVERSPEELTGEPFDVVLLQRPEELELVERWTGRRPGRDVPAVYVEHNAPQGRIADLRHPLAGQSAIPIVHVTPFNALFWECGNAPTRVIDHGIPDPGLRYAGELPRAAVVINEAARRGRVTGTDLLPGLAGDGIGVDLFGIDADTLGGVGDLPHAELLGEVARRRVYVHPVRWTSLGLSLLEAMSLGMPVVALATTEVAAAIPASAGAVTSDPHELARAARRLIDDPAEARARGLIARNVAQQRYGLDRFLDDWDDLLMEVAA